MKVVLDESGGENPAALSLVAEWGWPHLGASGLNAWLHVRPPFATLYFMLVGEDEEVLGAAAFEVYDFPDDGSEEVDVAYCCVSDECGRRELKKLFVGAFAAVKNSLGDVSAVRGDFDLEEADFWRRVFPRHPKRVDVILESRGRQKLFLYAPVEKKTE